MKAGDKVKLKGTSYIGIVLTVHGDKARVIIGSIDRNGNGERVYEDNIDKFECITDGNNEGKCNTGEKRDAQGRFLPGTRPTGRRKKSISTRHIRSTINQQLEPFLNDLGRIIRQIDDPADQILAIARMMRYTVPTYSSVQFSEKPTRDLTAEERLAKLDASYNGNPDPTEKEDTDDEELEDEQN